MLNSWIIRKRHAFYRRHKSFSLPTPAVRTGTSALSWRRFRTSCMLLSGLALWLTACHSGDRKAGPPLSDAEKRMPENAVRSLKVTEGLEATLFAHEPMLTNPTNIDVDAQGRVWVCEGFNYRNQLNPKNPYHQAGDRILILTDTTGDGIADKQTVFYQGNDINAALGICVLDNRVIVSCSPNVFIFTDTDRDGQADRKEVFFSGIGGEQHDHGMHSFNFGPDGKLYFNFGNWGDSILDRNGQAIRDIDGDVVNNSGHPYRQGMVFRCNPDGSEFEVMAHNFRNDYEVAEDSYGGMWLSDNDDDGNRGVRIVWVMPHGNFGYTDEMTGEGWSARRINMEDSIPYRHWHLRDPGVVPNLLQTGAGSPTGILVYEGDLLPERFRGQLIHADAGPNVVRSYAVQEQGAGYQASIQNIVEGDGDNWFRPSDVSVAPDGSLFIADWYDPGVGGHQMQDPSHGRIYRIAPEGDAYHVPRLKLDDPADATEALRSPNNAVRYLAWTKLRAWGKEAVPALEKMYRDRNPRYRARALWLLSKLPDAGQGYVVKALKDDDANIRVTALRAAEELHMPLVPLVRLVLHDPSAQVRRAAAIALRHCRETGAAELWAALAAQYDGKDRWYLEALGIGADKQWDSYFGAWLQQQGEEWNTPAGRDIVWRSRAEAALPLLKQIVMDSTHRPDDYLKFFRAFHFHEKVARQATLLSMLRGDHPEQVRINTLVLTLLDPHTPMTPDLKRVLTYTVNQLGAGRDFVDLVSRYRLKDHNPALLSIARTGKDRGLRRAAAHALLDAGGAPLLRHALAEKDSTAETLIETLGHLEDHRSQDILGELLRDRSYPATLRIAAVKAYGRGWSGENRLLELARKGKLLADEKAAAAEALAKSYRSEIRDSAKVYLPLATSDDHALAAISELAAMEGHADDGHVVFRTYCQACHRLDGEGTEFGPGLSEIGSKLSKEALFTAVMDPSAGISFGYEGFVFTLKDGSTRLGYVSSTTDEGVTIHMIGGAVETIPSASIVSKKPYGSSLMPATLARQMNKQQLVDLVAYLSTLKKAG